MTPKCPKCETNVDRTVMHQLDAYSDGHPWNAVAYLCPSCGCVLGVQLDPLALKSDLVAEILKALGKGKKP